MTPVFVAVFGTRFGGHVLIQVSQRAGPTPCLFYNSDKRIQSMRSTASSRTSDMFLIPDLQPRTN